MSFSASPVFWKAPTLPLKVTTQEQGGRGPGHPGPAGPVRKVALYSQGTSQRRDDVKGSAADRRNSHDEECALEFNIPGAAKRWGPVLIQL